MRSKIYTKTFRLSAEEVAMLQHGAEELGMSESGWFRYLLRIGLLMNSPMTRKEMLGKKKG